MTLKTYREFRPTEFDSAGLGLEDHQDWIVSPVIRTRDSGPLEESNFAVFLRELESINPEGEDYETHRFGHWGPGWFEIVIVRPGTAAASYAEKTQRDLGDYPILDEHDLTEREDEAATQSWRNLSIKERVRLCVEARVSVFAARRDHPPYDDAGRIRDRLLY